MKEITFRVPDELAKLFVDWAKHMPEVEVVCQKESIEYNLDDIDRRMILAFEVLKKNGTLRNIYDYTWIMVAIGDGVIDGMGAFRSPQSFIDYLKSLGLERIPCRSTLSAWYNNVYGKFPNWEFTDTQDPQEILRRKNVVIQLKSAFVKAVI
jgi:hypothetical protein